ncbi:MAG: hypothetical protein HFH68_11385 [Lachnospiraceae bacterium]|nr:hypothetical protein [Lachnospiraceae bacterium]
MTGQFQENFFLAIRMVLLLALEIYIILTHYTLAGASAWMLLLLACFTGASVSKELTDGKLRLVLAGVSCILCICIIIIIGNEFLLLGIYIMFEILSMVKPGLIWYSMPFVPVCINIHEDTGMQLLITILIGMVYVQNDFIVVAYKKQAMEDMVSNQILKKDWHKREHKLQEEISSGMLMAQNQLLEEREGLSQALHDKLGHTINGSVYQLEAVKIIMEKEPDAAKGMVQAVINELRGGMDEIRLILRKELPAKYEMALVQLNKLCHECQQKGIETELYTEGELHKVPERYLHIILDNAYEAVSNSLKYSRCSKIEIKIYVMNQVVRCMVADNGTGCATFTDGMGIAGMRRRVREVNGILDFETEAGFKINMLFPEWNKKEEAGKGL